MKDYFEIDEIDDIYYNRKCKKSKRIKRERLKPFRGNVNQYSDLKSGENTHRRKRRMIRDQRGSTDEIYVPTVFKTNNWWDCDCYQAKLYKRLF